MLSSVAFVFAAALTAITTASPIIPTSEKLESFNSTLRVAWRQPDSQGIFQGGISLLLGVNGSNDSSVSPQEGVLLQFNQSVGLAANESRSSIPFIALVGCDNPEAMAENPSEGIIPTTSGNTTSFANETMSSAQAPDVFRLAEDLNAVALLFYSTEQESCTLNNSYFANVTNNALPVYALARRQAANLLLEQFSNVESQNRVYNATLLNAAMANLSSVQSGGAVDSIPNTGFLLCQITSNATDDAAPVVATIGRVSSTMSYPGNAASTARMSSSAGSSGGATASMTATPSSPVSGTARLGYEITSRCWTLLAVCLLFLYSM